LAFEAAPDGLGGEAPLPAAPRRYRPAMSRLDDLRSEYDRLVNSMEFAYAMGHSRTLGRDPRLEWVVERVAELRREIAALSDEQEPN
jgi:hypothetical protein